MIRVKFLNHQSVGHYVMPTVGSKEDDHNISFRLLASITSLQRSGRTLLFMRNCCIFAMMPSSMPMYRTHGPLPPSSPFQRRVTCPTQLTTEVSPCHQLRRRSTTSSFSTASPLIWSSFFGGTRMVSVKGDPPLAFLRFWPLEGYWKNARSEIERQRWSS